MFSSLSKKLSSFSPRAVLAAQISSALSEHFVVDPEEIESSLLADAKILLKNTELRKRHYRSEDAPNVVVTIEGCVEEVLFSWTWSFLSSAGQGASSSGGGMVKDATLTIKGLNVRIGLQAWDEMKDEDIELLASGSSTDEGPSKPLKQENEGYMQAYIQQIVDNLTLKVDDYQFSVQLNDGTSLVMTGEGVELVTLASANISKSEAASTKNILSQLLSLRVFSVVARDGNDEYPLIDPFGYVVSVTRVSGKRFQGGILSGLEVIGLPPKEEISLYLGREQLKIVSEIGMLLRPPDHNQEEYSGAKPSSGEAPESVGGVSEKSLSTRFSMALPNLSLVLVSSCPTRITLLSATLEYQTDGEICKLEGSRGITDNGTPLVQLNSGSWELDFVKQKFSIKKGVATEGCDACEEAISKIHVKDASLKRILSSVKEILNYKEISILKEAYTDTPESFSTKGTESKPWILAIDGTAVIFAEGEGEDGATTERVEMHISPVELIASPVSTDNSYTLTKLHCEGMKFKSSIDDMFEFDIPPFSLLDGALKVDNFIEASITSTDQVKAMQEFAITFMHSWQSNYDSSAHVDPPESIILPFSISAKGVKVRVERNNLDILISQIGGTADVISMESITYLDSFGNAFDANDIAIRPNSQPSAKISIGKVQRFIFPGSLSLAFPVENLALDLSTNNISVDLSMMHLSLQIQKDVNSSDAQTQNSKQMLQTEQTNLELNLNLAIDNLQVDLYQGSDENMSGKIQVANLSLNTFVSGSVVKAEMRSKLSVSLLDSHSDWIKGYIEPFAIETNCLDPTDLQALRAGRCGVTSSSFGNMEVTVASLAFEDVAKQPLRNLMVGHVEVNSRELATIQNAQDLISRVVTGKEGGSGGGSESEAPLCSPFPISFQGAKLSISDQSTILKIGPTSVSGSNLFCNEIICSGLNKASCRVKNIKVTHTSSVEVSIGIIDQILLPPEQNLSIEPIAESQIIFEDKILKVKINTLNASLHKSAGEKAAIREKIDCVDSDLAHGIDLPFSINVEVSRSALLNQAGTSVSAADINVNVCSEGNLLNFDTIDSIKIRLSHSNDWLDMHIQPSFAALSDFTMCPTAFSFGGLNVGPCSMGILDINLPSFTRLPDASHISLDDVLSIKMESLEFLQQIREMVSSCTDLQEDPLSPTNAPNGICTSHLYKLPFSIEVPTIELAVNKPRTVVKGQNLLIKEHTVQCFRVSVNGEDGMKGSAQNCELDLSNTDISVKIEEITGATLPGIATLAEPCSDLSISFQGGKLDVNVPSIKCFPSNSQLNKGSGKGSAPTIISLPFPIQMRVQSFMLQDLSLQSSVSIENFAVRVKQTGSYMSIQTGNSMRFRGRHTSEYWIDAHLGTLTACISSENSGLCVKKVDCLGIMIGPASPTCGRFKANVPRMHFDGDALEIVPRMHVDGDALEIFETVNISIAQLDSEVVESAQTLIQGLCCLIPFDESQSSVELPFSIKLPAIRILVTTPKISITAAAISAAATTVSCKTINATLGQEASSSLSDLNFDFNLMKVEMGLIETLFVAGVVVLPKPVRCTTIEFNDDMLSIRLPHPVHVNVLSTTDEKATSQKEKNTGIECPNIPIAVKIEINEMYVSQQGQSTCTRVDDMSLTVEPFTFEAQNVLEEIPMKGAHISMKVKEASSELFRVDSVCSTFVAPLHDLNTLNKLQLSMSSVQVTSGFSSIDWDSLFSTKKESSSANSHSINIPFGHIESFNLSISYDGMILASQSNILVPQFKGDASTGSQDIVAYYKKTVMGRVPGFLTNAKFLGGNVVDTSFQTAAIAGKMSMAGVGAGSVMGVAVADAVRAGIASGKKARNVDGSDGYKFGDFTRGSIRGLKEATKAEGTRRGGDDKTYEYVPGDLIAGSARAVGGYASNNKAKLTTAGGTGIASAVGFAVAGPLGFIAGSYFGGKAVKNFVGEDNPSKQASAAHSNPHNPPTSHSQQANDPFTPVAERPLNNSNSSNPPTPHSQQAYDPFTPPAQTLLNHSNPHNSAPTYPTPSGTLNVHSQHSEKSVLTQQGFDSYAKQSPTSSQLLPQNAHTNVLISQQRPPHSYSSTTSTPSEQLQGTQPLPRGSANHTAHQYNIPAASQSNFQGHAAPTMHQASQQGLRSSTTSAISGQTQGITQQAPRGSTHPTGYQHNNPATSQHNGQAYAAPTMRQMPQQGMHQSSAHQQQHRDFQHFHPPPPQRKGYQFGDLTKSVVDKGKKSDGRKEDSGYKFGTYSIVCNIVTHNTKHWRQLAIAPFSIYCKLTLLYKIGDFTRGLFK